MRYYKIILNKEFVGAISSNNFIKYQPVLECFLRSDEIAGEYVDFNCLLYRDTWMAPVTQQRDFIQASIVAISEEEYEVYIEAMKNNEEIHEETEEEDPTPVIPNINPNEEASIEFMKYSKTLEMSRDCKAAIENGFDLMLRGESHHFSLSTQDQLNLMALSTTLNMQDMIPYHADNEETKFYSAEEIKAIIDGAAAHKTYHTTYYNILKSYINSLDSIETIAAITYGIDVPTEFHNEVWQVITK